MLHLCRVELNSEIECGRNATFESIAFDYVEFESNVRLAMSHLRQKSDSDSKVAFVSCRIQCIIMLMVEVTLDTLIVVKLKLCDVKRDSNNS